MRIAGFSTGALSRGDFQSALALLAENPNITAVELSALRLHELVPLLDAIPSLDLDQFQHVSIHAPIDFTALAEPMVAELLRKEVPLLWPIVVHPDTIHDFAAWRPLGSRIAIENMDSRKGKGKTAEELRDIFARLPEAHFCFDIGHARQVDPSMDEARKMLLDHRAWLTHIHVSDVAGNGAHEPMTQAAALSFRMVTGLLGREAPLIVESRVGPGEIEHELDLAVMSLEW